MNAFAYKILSLFLTYPFKFQRIHGISGRRYHLCYAKLRLNFDISLLFTLKIVSLHKEINIKYDT